MKRAYLKRASVGLVSIIVLGGIVVSIYKISQAKDREAFDRLTAPLRATSRIVIWQYYGFHKVGSPFHSQNEEAARRVIADILGTTRKHLVRLHLNDDITAAPHTRVIMTDSNGVETFIDLILAGEYGGALRYKTAKVTAIVHLRDRGLLEVFWYLEGLSRSAQQRAPADDTGSTEDK